MRVAQAGGRAAAARTGSSDAAHSSRPPAPPTPPPPPFSQLGCPEGRSAATWVDYNLYGHQLVCHAVAGYDAAAATSAVDGDPVPVPHFGLALAVPDFHALADRVRAAGVAFELEPHLRFRGPRREGGEIEKEGS